MKPNIYDKIPYHESVCLSKQLNNYMKNKHNLDCNFYFINPDGCYYENCNYIHDRRIKNEIINFEDTNTISYWRDKKMMHCFHYMKGECNKPNCDFIHNDTYKNFFISYLKKNNKYDFICPNIARRNQCKINNCIWNHDEKYNGMNENKEDNMCPYFNTIDGCTNFYCLFSHPQILCINYFIKKKCNPDCKYSHKLTKECLYNKKNWKIILYLQIKGININQSVISDYHSKQNRNRSRDHYKKNLYDKNRSRSRSRDHYKKNVYDKNRSRSRSRDHYKKNVYDKNRSRSRSRDHYKKKLYDKNRSRSRSRDHYKKNLYDKNRSRSRSRDKDYRKPKLSYEELYNHYKRTK